VRPAREAFGTGVPLRRTIGIRSHPAPRDRLELERDQTEDMVAVDLKARRDREPATDRATRALMGARAE